MAVTGPSAESEAAAYWGVPTLDPAMQATAADLAGLVAKWGTIGRRRRMRGLYHFYAHDYKFAGLWRHPTTLTRSGCRAAVEANYSITDETPAAEALWSVFRKRCLARFWQARGVRIFADLNVGASRLALGMIGIPAGWTAYATRKHRGVPLRLIEAEHEAACLRAGTDAITFAVVGGGRPMRRACDARGWHYLAEDSDRARGKG